MSHTQLGMNTTTAHGVASTVSGLGVSLEFIEQQVRQARTMSLNPLNFMLNPGSLILSPASIGIALSASTDIANARAQLDYLVLKLQQETTQQEQVSASLLMTDPGWFAQAPSAQKPDNISMADQAWDEFGDFVNIAGYISMIEGAFETIADALDTFKKNTPPWAKEVIKWGDNFGKWVPFVGAPLSWTSVATEWDDDNAWGNTRNIIGATLATAELVCLIPPLTPAAPIVGAVGLAWDVMDTVWDLGDEFWW